MILHLPLREVSIVRILVLVSLLCAMTAASAEIYRWTDVNGKEVYGDEPPENARAVQEVELPVLTVAESFKGKPFKPTTNQAPTSSEPTEQVTNSPKSNTATSQTSQAENDSEVASGYENFSILVPGRDEVVRSNTGDFKIKIDLKPALKTGHGIVVYVDGRQIGETTSDTIDVTGIERGEHSVFAVLHDAKDAILGNTEAVNFTVMRSSLASRARTGNNALSKNSSSTTEDSSTDAYDSSTLRNRRF